MLIGTSSKALSAEQLASPLGRKAIEQLVGAKQRGPASHGGSAANASSTEQLCRQDVAHAVSKHRLVPAGTQSGAAARAVRRGTAAGAVH